MKKPEIELYLYSLTQEFPVGKDHEMLAKRNYNRFIDDAGTEVETERISTSEYVGPALNADTQPKWDVQWKKNWSKTTPWDKKTKVRGLATGDKHPLTHLKIREEEFGGIAFDPIYDRVYKVNKDGYYLLDKLISDVDTHEYDSKNYNEVDPLYLRKFISFLDEHKLWM